MTKWNRALVALALLLSLWAGLALAQNAGGNRSWALLPDLHEQTATTTPAGVTAETPDF